MTTTHPAPLQRAARLQVAVDRSPALSPRSDVELAVEQLAAIDAFNRNIRDAQQEADAAARSGEMRSDSAHRMAVLRRQQQAVIAHSHAQLRATGELLASRAPQRAVLVHRNARFLDRVAATLREHGIRVVATLDNGADAIGTAVCEQPDLVLVEDRLAMVPGEQVLREIRRLCPSTALAAQCPEGGRVRALMEAGAQAVFTRKIPPVDVATGMRALLPA